MESDKTSEQVPTVRGILLDWANEQDHWVRFIVATITASHCVLSDAEVDQIYNFFMTEKGLLNGDLVQFPGWSSGSGKEQPEETLVLQGLSDVQNVNALAQGQQIQFNRRMTIFFGENGSGKTGYVRILKRVASARSAEDILGNIGVTANERGKPSAKLQYALGDQTLETIWNGEAGLHPLTAIDIFDSLCSELHLDEALSYIYTPGDLSLFPIVQESIEKIKDKFEQDIKAKTPASNSFLEFFERGSPLFPKIESLGASTDIPELKELSVVTAAEQQGLPDLEQQLAALRANTIVAQLQMVKTQQAFYQQVHTLFEVFLQFDRQIYLMLRDQVINARQAHEQATRHAFDNTGIKSVLTNEWKDFIRSAEAYLQHIDEASYPSKADSCIYCQQALSEPALELISKYRTFCSGELQKAVETNESALFEVTKGLVSTDVGSLIRTATSLTTQADGPEKQLLQTLKSLLDRIELLQNNINGLNAPKGESLEKELQLNLGKVKTRFDEITLAISTLEGRVRDRQKAQSEIEAKVRDIKARLTLHQRFPAIQAYVSDSKWADKARIYLGRFQALFRSLTDASKLASDQLLNHNFERYFGEECEVLRAPSVKLTFPGRQGHATRKKFVTNDHRLSEIFSEGQQKVVALADFLAEARMKDRSSPLIFDDPVTSLDYRRLPEVAARLVDLSLKRQVVVFTHNIWFATELLARFEDIRPECFYYDIRNEGDKYGLINKANHPRSDTFNTLKSQINSLIQNAQSVTGEAQAALIEKGYEYLRSICEVIVETDLLNGVVRRYQPNIMMTKLLDIKCDRLSDVIGQINAIFGKCCRYISSHSQPLETLNVRPKLADLKNDWHAVETARETYMKSN